MGHAICLTALSKMISLMRSSAYKLENKIAKEENLLSIKTAIMSDICRDNSHENQKFNPFDKMSI